MTDATFDPAAWIAQVQRMANDANSGCGLSYELFEARLSSMVTRALTAIPSEFQQQAIGLATPLGYVPAENCAMNQEDSGLCGHGLEPYHCPIGCGDRED